MEWIGLIGRVLAAVIWLANDILFFWILAIQVKMERSFPRKLARGIFAVVMVPGSLLTVLLLVDLMPAWVSWLFVALFSVSMVLVYVWFRRTFGRMCK